VIVSATTGQEISRTATDAKGNAILDQVVASARISAPPPGRLQPLTPPATGDAGLLAALQ